MMDVTGQQSEIQIPSKTDTAVYIAAMLGEMVTLAEQTGSVMLVYLIDMAKLHAVSLIKV